MTNSPEKINISQRPDLGVKEVLPTDALVLSGDELPWVHGERAEINTVLVTLESGQSFRYGSAIAGNHSVEKLADQVAAPQSLNAEQGMFKALPALLDHKPAPNAEIVSLKNTEISVYKTTKKGNDVARLYFALFKDTTGTDVVLRVGIAKHKNQQELMAVFNRGHLVRKKDGGSR